MNALQRKLHGWELLHLRQVVSEQQALLDELTPRNRDLTRELQYAEDCAERWRDDCLQAMDDAGCIPGLTVDGNVIALPQGALQ